MSLGDAFVLNFREEDNAIGLKADISEISQWIEQSPIELQQPLDRLSGSAAIDGTIHLEKGLEDQFSFRSVNASLDHPAWSGIQADVSGRYLSSKKNRSVILDSVFLRKNSSSLKIKGRLEISRKQAQIEAEGHLALSDLDGSLPVEWGTDWSGTADVRARFKGKIDRPDWQDALKVELDLKDFGFQRGDDLQIRKIKGQVSWRKGQIELENLLMTLGQQELYADGRIRNWTAAQPPELNLRIRTQSLEWTGSEEGESTFELPEYRGQVTLEADHLRADQLVLQAVRADLSLRDQEIGIDQLYAQGIGGGESQGRIQPHDQWLELKHQWPTDWCFHRCSVQSLLQLWTEYPHIRTAQWKAQCRFLSAPAHGTRPIHTPCRIDRGGVH